MTADGETPLADFDGLRKRHVRTRAQLAIVEAENVRHAVIRYLVAQPSRRIAPFDFGWMLRLHAEMFGEVWSWAGKGEKVPATKSGQTGRKKVAGTFSFPPPTGNDFKKVGILGHEHPLLRGGLLQERLVVRQR